MSQYYVPENIASYVYTAVPMSEQMKHKVKQRLEQLLAIFT